MVSAGLTVSKRRQCSKGKGSRAQYALLKWEFFLELGHRDGLIEMPNAGIRKTNWQDKVRGVDHKPGSVLGNHSSVMLVAKHL